MTISYIPNVRTAGKPKLYQSGFGYGVSPRLDLAQTSPAVLEWAVNAMRSASVYQGTTLHFGDRNHYMQNGRGMVNLYRTRHLTTGKPLQAPRLICCAGVSRPYAAVLALSVDLQQVLREMQADAIRAASQQQGIGL